MANKPSLAERPRCGCGNPVAWYHTNRTKTKYLFRTHCDSCRKKPWKKHKGKVCERCGFVPEWSGQLDVDHIDGDWRNNDPDNLQTLCANCHRLKTFEHRDFNLPSRQKTESRPGYQRTRARNSYGPRPGAD